MIGRIIGSGSCSSGWRVCFLLALEASNGCVRNMCLLRKSCVLVFSRLIHFRKVPVVFVLCKALDFVQLFRRLENSEGTEEVPRVSGESCCLQQRNFKVALRWDQMISLEQK